MPSCGFYFVGAFLGSSICFRYAEERVSLRSPVRVIVGVIAVLLVVALAWPLAAQFPAVDTCLDRGGSYDFVLSVGDLRQNHP
jgi:hypothetical protein